MPSAPPQVELRVASRPPQFSLRALFIFCTLAAVLCGLMNGIGLFWSTIVVTVLALIAAHVFGNALGTRLRRDTDETLTQSDRSASQAALPPFAEQRLAQRTRLGGAAVMITVLSALAGGALGGALIVAAVGEKITPGGIALAILSLSSLGGLLGFLASTLFSTTHGAWRDAIAEQRGSRDT